MTESNVQTPEAQESQVEAAAEVSVAATQAAETDAKLAIENRARRMGWAPKEEFRGDPARWVSAERFVERGENEIPIMRERMRRADEHSQKVERELLEVKTRLNETLDAFGEFREFASRSEERAFNKAKAEIEARMAQAATVGDASAYNTAKYEHDRLLADAPKPAPERKTSAPPPAQTSQPSAPVPQLDPATQAEIVSWVRSNPWFNIDPEMNQTATALYGAIEQSKPHLSTAQKLAEVKRAVSAIFPDRFENPARSAPGAVSTPTTVATTTNTAKPKGKTFDDLPPEAKRACDRYVATIPPNKTTGKKFTREDYVKMYFAGEQ